MKGSASPGERAEIKHESDLRDIHAVPLSLVPRLEKSLVGFLPGQRAVGAIEEHSVHAGVCQKLRLFAENPLVRGLVVAEQRFLPEKESWFLASPGWMIVILHGLGIPADDLGDVLHPVGGVIVALMPGPEKHRDKLSVSLRRSVIVGSDLSAKSVGSGP